MSEPEREQRVQRGGWPVAIGATDLPGLTPSVAYELNGAWAEQDWSGVPVRPRSDEPPADLPEESSWLDELENVHLGPVEWLRELAPSVQLMAELENLPPDLVESDSDAVEMVAHWQRMESYCAMQKRLAAAELAKRDAMANGLVTLKNLGKLRGDPNIAGDELALRLGIGRRAASSMVRSGRAFGGLGIPTAEALAAGEIDGTKADAIIAAVENLPGLAAIDVQDKILKKAPHIPTRTVQRELAKAVAEIDPEHYEQRCQEAMQKRRVDRPRPLPDGMAGLYAVMPGVEAIQLYRALDAAARSATSEGDERTLDQLRADALGLMGSTAVQTGWIGSCPAPPEAAVIDEDLDARQPAGLPADQPSAPAGCGMRVGVIGGRSAHVRVTVPLTAMMGGEGGPGADLEGADDPATLEGYGPIPASVARALAAGGTWARMVTDPVDLTVLEVSRDVYKVPQRMADLVRARQPECASPHCTIPADSCDIHHILPWPVGATSVANTDPQCRHDHNLLTHGGWEYFVDRANRTRIWHTPAGLTYREDAEGNLHQLRNGKTAEELAALRAEAEARRRLYDGPPPF